MRRAALPRYRWVACAVIALVGLLAVVIAGAQGYARRTFVLESPNQLQVALLRRGGTALCEGPVSSPHPFAGVAIWGRSVIGTARVQVTVRAAADARVLATGLLQTDTRNQEWTAALNRQLGTEPVRVCLTSALNTFALLGSSPVDPRVKLTGRPAGAQYSLALLSDRSRSLFGSLSLGFSRAALFRPSWVGAWTFWIFAAGLLSSFAGLLVAVASADSNDDAPPSELS